MIPASLLPNLRVPVVAAPMFLTSGPDLVVETCRAGAIGTFPALNNRTTAGFADWLDEIAARKGPEAAAHGVNLIVHRTNPRLEADLRVVVEKRVPLVITSLGAVPDLIREVHAYGGVVFHDVISIRHARKAMEAGVDGLIAVCAGAGGHAGTLSPFALVSEIRQFFGGCVLLAGAINTGAQVFAARAMGADLAYLGSRFMVADEAMIPDAQKQMMIDCTAADIVYTDAISGVHANFLRPSLVAAGLDPENLVKTHGLDMNEEAKVWRDIWSAGQGVGGITRTEPAAAIVADLARGYAEAAAAAAADPFAAALRPGRPARPDALGLTRSV
jgi:nitronate monooxygenase